MTLNEIIERAAECYAVEEPVDPDPNSDLYYGRCTICRHDEALHFSTPTEDGCRHCDCDGFKPE